MGPDAVHFIVDPNSFLVEISFYDQGGIFVRYNPDFPAGRIRRLGRVAPVS
jgi:hypothetical protein